MKEESKISKSDLDYIVNQLKQSQEETATNLAVQPARSINLPKKSVKSWLLPIVLVVIVCLAAFFGWRLYSQKEGISSVAVVESIQNLATLTTAKAQIKTIVSKEDKKLFGKDIPIDIPGTKRTLFMVVPGEVTAGINLENLTKKDIELDSKTKEIQITLPHATIVQAPSIDTKSVQTFSDEGLFRSGVVNWEDGSQLEEVAKQKIEKEAIEFGLLKIAEDNARTALKDFYKNLDYTVTVTFK